MTKDSPHPVVLVMLGIIAAALIILCFSVRILTEAVLLDARVNEKTLELTDELVKIEWQVHGPDLDAYYPVDPTFDPSESSTTL